ncbi:MAG TPA: MFS transporter [Pseudonocardiaceae bacterium]|jgi:YNFM family putative membrane transporter|nr:MFS transporter [Pseudonocardiaceae bacterium]
MPAELHVSGTTPVVERHSRGTPGFRRVSLAMFSAGLATFTTLYCVQALLPALATQFSLSPAAASLAVSVSTAALAIGVIPLTALSEAIGRTPMMTAALFTSAILGILSAVSPNFAVLLILRTLQGLALAGLQAVAMTYLAEELHRRSLGFSMGLFIAGNGFGGMAGRLIAALVGDVAGWRWALAVVGLVALACSIVFRLTVLPSRHFHARPLHPRVLASAIGRAFTDTGLLRLFAVGVLAMSVQVTVYNYLGFRLLRAPFGLSASVVGLIFVVYLAGSVSSTVAGRLADRFGRPRMLWLAAVVLLAGVALLVPDELAVVVAGLVVLTAGFFAVHALASGWVGARSATLGVQGSAVYLCCYYLGSSVGGSVGGIAFGSAGWPGTTWFIGALALVVLAIGVGLRTLVPARPTAG